MRQFDICRLRPAAASSQATQLVVVLQSDLTSDLATRVVAPLVPADALPAIGRLRPAIAVDGRPYRLIVDRLSVLSTKHLGSSIGTCADREYDIRRALDIVFLGV